MLLCFVGDPSNDGKVSLLWFPRAYLLKVDCRAVKHVFDVQPVHEGFAVEKVFDNLRILQNLLNLWR